MLALCRVNLSRGHLRENLNLMFPYCSQSFVHSSSGIGFGATKMNLSSSNSTFLHHIPVSLFVGNTLFISAL